MSLSGHLWTILPNLRHRMFPLRAPRSREWSAPVGPGVELSGRWHHPPGATEAVVVVHGLGGCFDRHYCVRMAREAERKGWACLRLALRGADRRGHDFHHAGLTEDLDAALASAELAGFRTIHLVGYSLGGHLVLRWAGTREDPRVRGVVAVCPPLDLARGQRHLDERAPGFYRRHVLAGLNEIYGAVARRREVPTPVERVAAVRTLREWDSLTIVPRFGFADVDDYYTTQSAARVLDRLRVPALVVASRRDPMVRIEDVEAAASGSRLRLVACDAGGHVGFPGSLDLGEAAPRGLEAQVSAWSATRPRDPA